MELLHQVCAGIDVHKDNVFVCIRKAEGAKAKVEVKQFGTMTRDLLQLSEWLTNEGVRKVAMESTGVYWKPVWHILEEGFDLVLANAQQIKAVPGRKSDVKDCQWIADLLAHELIAGSFVPPLLVQDARDFMRTRKQFIREKAQHTLRIQKILEDANIKLASVVSDILGSTARKVLDAIVLGESDPAKLVLLLSNKYKTSRDELQASLQGKVTNHHRFLIKKHLEHIDSILKTIDEIDKEIEQNLNPLFEAAKQLEEIPGISLVAGLTIVSEIGLDMSRFATAGHLLSWAGLCPKMDESAGKHRSTRIRKGSPWLKPVLVQSAWAAVRNRNTYYHAQFQRLRARRGAKKAIIAVAASMLTGVYHMLNQKSGYRELGSDYFTRYDKEKNVKKLCRRLHDMGYEVQLKSAG
jgi:transposase